MKFEYHAVLGLQYSHDDNDKVFIKESRRERRSRERMRIRQEVANKRRSLSW